LKYLTKARNIDFGDMNERTYLGISHDVVTEGMSCDSQIRMHCPPVTEERVVVNRIDLVKKHRFFDTWLIVGLGVVVDFGVRKFMINLFPSHLVIYVLQNDYQERTVFEL
jgi:hypothetical protein